VDVKVEIREKEKDFDLAVKWLAESGIQSQGGGVYSWYDINAKDYPYLYSEITGYAITSFLFIYSITKDKSYIDKADKAAQWIINHAVHECGGVRTRLYSQPALSDNDYSFEAERIFSFDTGMVLYGLINLYTKTSNKKYLKLSLKMADFLTDTMQSTDGSIFPAYDARSGKISESYDKWSNQRGSFHSKAGLGFTDMFIATSDKKYKNSAIKICEYALTMQDGSGRFITDKKSGTTNLHPHCYSSEGLWYTGTHLDIPEFRESAKKATEWLYGKLKEDGLYELYDPLRDGFNELQRTDVLAQALRLGMIFSMPEDKISMLKNRLLEYQNTDRDKHESGGFYYSKDKACINSWCSMFAIQALWMSDNRAFDSKELLLI